MAGSDSAKQLQDELKHAQRLVKLSEPWVLELRDRLGNMVSRRGDLPIVCSFFTRWPHRLLRSITVLVEQELHNSALLLLRPLIEAHIELSFILHKDCAKRASEYLKASQENRTPYKDQPGYKTYGQLGRRAGSSGLGELYRKTYNSLSYYAHLRIKGSLAEDPQSEKTLREATACLIVGKAIFAKIIRQLSRAFRYRMKDALAREASDALKQYKQLIEQQEEAFSRLKRIQGKK